jgi:hypothetical protein
MSLKEFSKNLVRELPEKWNTNLDEVSLNTTNGRQAGFRRDDLCAFILELPKDDDWSSEKIYIHIPNEVSSIPDRTGNPMVGVEPTIEDVKKHFTGGASRVRRNI